MFITFKRTSRILTKSLMLIGLLYSVVFSAPYNQDDEDYDPLPLKPTKNISFTTNEITWMSLDVSPDGRTIVFETLGDLYTLPISGGKATQITTGMAHDSQPRYSPDGNNILFVSDRSGSENLWMLKTGKNITDTTAESFGSGLHAVTRGRDASYASPEWSPDGQYVVSSKTDRYTWIDVNHSLWMYHVDGGSGVQLLVADNPIYGLGPAFGSSNRYLYTTYRSPGGNAYGHQIYRFDRETGSFFKVTNRTGGAIRPALSSDGQWMVYGTRFDGETGYILHNTNTGTETWLSYPIQPDTQENNWMGTSSDHLPGYSFTPDNNAIITSIEGKLYRIAIPSGQKTEIPFEVDVSVDIVPVIHFDEPVPDGNVQVRLIRWPSLSPNGTKLVFTAVHRLYIQDFTTERTERIAKMEEIQSSPSWSKDGEWISFVTWSDYEGGHVYKVESNGRNLQRLSQVPAFYSDPVWTPDGSELIVTKGPRQQRGNGLRWVSMPTNGGEATDIGIVRGSRPHFIDNSDRMFYYNRSDGLASVKRDGTNPIVHLNATGRRPALGPGGPQPASDILMSPDGRYVLINADYNVYRAAMPFVGEQLTISVTRPESERFPIEKLNSLGTHFMNWGPNGDEVTWSLGKTVFRYNIDEAEKNSDYEPEKFTIDLEFPRQKGEGTIVFRGARLLTMEPEASSNGIIDDGAVVIENNRISQVGPSSTITTPTGAREINVRGMTILPGFVDLHTHWRPETGVHRNVSWEYLNYLAFGVTTTRNASDRIDNLTYGDLVEMGEMVGPRIYSTGPAIRNNTNILTPEEARNVILRYREYYNHNTIKQYIACDRTTRQLLSIALQDLNVTPTTEGVDMKLMITQMFDG